MTTFKRFLEGYREERDEKFLKHWVNQMLNGFKDVPEPELNNQNITKAVLRMYKGAVRDGSQGMRDIAEDMIRIARKMGFDNPEFKTIERSMELKEEHKEQVIPETDDLEEFAYFYEKGADVIEYNYGRYKSSMSAHRSDEKYTKDLWEVRYDYKWHEVVVFMLRGKRPCAIADFDPERTPPFNGDVLIGKDFVQGVLGDVSDKDAALKRILVLYKDVTHHDISPFEGHFFQSHEFFSMLLIALHEGGYKWPELDTIRKSFRS